MLWHDTQQNSEEWFNLRLGKATMSHGNAIMAYYPKKFGDTALKYALQLALEKINGVKAEYSFSNKHMLRGIAQESIAVALYEEENFVSISNGGFFDHDDWGDSPDGLIDDDGIIEIKSVIAETHYETMMRGTPDPAYKWQIIGHLDASGRDWVDFVSYCSDFPEGNQLLTYRVHRDDVMNDIAALRVRRREFIELVQQVLLTIKK